MLNENTRKTLKSLTSVSNTAVIRFPIATVAQKDKSLIAFVNLEDLGEEPFGEFGVSYLNDLLNLVEFYEGANVELNDSIIDIKTENAHQRYRTTDLDMMKAFDVPESITHKMAEATPTVKFDITKDDLDRFKKIGSLVKSDYMVIGDNEITVCKLDATNNLLDESTTDYIMDVNDLNEKIVIDMQNIDKIPSGNYEVRMIKNAKSGNFISLWTSEDSPVKIVVSVSKTF